MVALKSSAGATAERLLAKAACTVYVTVTNSRLAASARVIRCLLCTILLMDVISVIVSHRRQ